MTSTTTSLASLPRASWRASRRLRTALVLGGAALVAVAAALALIALVHVPIGDALAAFADGAWGSPYAIGASINRSLVFALVGGGFVLANRAQLTNVVRPLAKAAAIIKFSVPVTVGMSNTTSAPRRRLHSATMYPRLSLISAPRASRPLRC